MPSETAPHKSTNDRSFTAGVARAAFRILNPIPWLAAPLSEALFFTPPRPAPSRGARDFLATGRPSHVTGAGQRLAVWSWGEGPAVILAHGWGGLGSQLSAFVSPLLAEGLKVVMFDEPGHGASSGSRSSAIDFARAIEALAGAFPETQAVIAHSLGATGTAVAICRGLRLSCAVLVGPPADPARFVEGFARDLGIAPEVVVAMKARSERRLGLPWSTIGFEELVRVRGTPLLVFHDREDQEVPFTEGVAVSEAWGGELVATSGLGHRRILRDPGVVERTTSFVVERLKDDRRKPDCLQELGTLERYLYMREGR